MKPLLLDLFCGAGGAARGYQQAGFYVVGVDIRPQPRYAGDEFFQADAMTFPLDGFDAIHASPPCQAFTTYAARSTIAHPELIDATRERLRASGLPFVIENVEGAPLLSPVRICGSGFPELRVKRHRLFESNVGFLGIPCQHDRRPADIAIMNRGWKLSRFVPVYGGTGCKAKDLWPSAMGVDWMTHRELAQAIPPAYTAYIGERLMAAIKAAVPA